MDDIKNNFDGSLSWSIMDLLIDMFFFLAKTKLQLKT